MLRSFKFEHHSDLFITEGTLMRFSQFLKSLLEEILIPELTINGITFDGRNHSGYTVARSKAEQIANSVSYILLVLVLTFSRIRRSGLERLTG